MKHILMLAVFLVFCAHPVRGQTPPSQEAREKARLELLEKLKDKKEPYSKDECIAALASPYIEVRRKAAHDLGEFVSEADSVIPALELALSDKDQGVRLNAVVSLLQVAKACRKVAEATLPQNFPPDKAQEFKKKVNGSIGKIVALLAQSVRSRDRSKSRDETREVRKESARALGDLATPEAVTALKDARGMEDIPEVQSAITDALKRAGSPEDIASGEPAVSNEQGGKTCSVCGKSHSGKAVKGHQIYCPLQGCYGHWDADRPHCSRCKRNHHHLKDQHDRP